MKKMINPRAGHAPDLSSVYLFLHLLGIGLLIGWPVLIPVFIVTSLISEHIVYIPPLLDQAILLFSAIVGAYPHYKLWKALINWLKK